MSDANRFKIATWNVNSLRVRLPHVLAWLEREKPDVLALQETKITDADFPFGELQAAGYHVLASGQKTYNGMATLSRKEATNIITDIPDYTDPSRRILCATVNGICIVNLYVPNGQSVGSDKYQYKLTWLQKLESFLRRHIADNPKMILLGDFNIAPTDLDVHDPLQWQGSVLVSELERHAFREMLAIGFKDCLREKFPTDALYSWWDYRMNAFKRNLGLRIDHILATDVMRCLDCRIDKSTRELERPSDHAPVIAEFHLDL